MQVCFYSFTLQLNFFSLAWDPTCSDPDATNYCREFLVTKWAAEHETQIEFYETVLLNENLWQLFLQMADEDQSFRHEIEAEYLMWLLMNEKSETRTTMEGTKRILKASRTLFRERLGNL